MSYGLRGDWDRVYSCLCILFSAPDSSLETSGPSCCFFAGLCGRLKFRQKDAGVENRIIDFSAKFNFAVFATLINRTQFADDRLVGRITEIIAIRPVCGGKSSANSRCDDL
jgi:hypothetical protein